MSSLNGPIPGDEELEALLDLAVGIAVSAGEILLSMLGDAVQPTVVAATKSSRTDMVTSADRASEAHIVSTLRRARPNDAILAEESGDHAGSGTLTWVVDPLDGTTNYLYGFPVFGVSIAAQYAGSSLVGVVRDPLRGETFGAVAGRGARLNGRSLGPPPMGEPTPPLGEALVGTGFGYAAERRAGQARLLPAVLPAVRDIRRGGAAALDLCWLAAGRLDAFYEAGLQPWDRAAGTLVATESGIEVRDIDRIVPGVATLVAGRDPLCRELADLLLRAAAEADAQ